jgi:hypothetical protein
MTRNCQFSQQYGFWRSYVEQAIYFFCGNQHKGVALVKGMLQVAILNPNPN